MMLVVLLALLPVVTRAYFADWSLLARDREPTCVDIPQNMTLCHNIGEINNWLSIFFSLYLFIYLSIYLFICLFIHLQISFYLSVALSIDRSIYSIFIYYLYIFLFLYIILHLCTNIYVLCTYISVRPELANTPSYVQCMINDEIFPGRSIITSFQRDHLSLHNFISQTRSHVLGRPEASSVSPFVRQSSLYVCVLWFQYWGYYKFTYTYLFSK